MGGWGAGPYVGAGPGGRPKEHPERPEHKLASVKNTARVEPTQPCPHRARTRTRATQRDRCSTIHASSRTSTGGWSCTQTARLRSRDVPSAGGSSPRVSQPHERWRLFVVRNGTRPRGLLFRQQELSFDTRRRIIALTATIARDLRRRVESGASQKTSSCTRRCPPESRGPGTVSSELSSRIHLVGSVPTPGGDVCFDAVLTSRNCCTPLRLANSAFCAIGLILTLQRPGARVRHHLPSALPRAPFRNAHGAEY